MSWALDGVDSATNDLFDCHAPPRQERLVPSTDALRTDTTDPRRYPVPPGANMPCLNRSRAAIHSRYLTGPCRI